MEDPGSWTLDTGSRFPDAGSRVLDLEFTQFIKQFIFLSKLREGGLGRGGHIST